MTSISDFELIPIEKMTKVPDHGNFKIRDGRYYVVYNGNILKHKKSGSIQCNSDKRVVGALSNGIVFKEIKTEIIFIERTFEEI